MYVAHLPACVPGDQSKTAVHKTAGSMRLDLLCPGSPITEEAHVPPQIAALLNHSIGSCNLSLNTDLKWKKQYFLLCPLVKDQICFCRKQDVEDYLQKL